MPKKKRLEKWPIFDENRGLSPLEKNSIFRLFGLLAPVVQTSDSAIHRINHYPADSVIDFRNTYPLDGDLSDG